MARQHSAEDVELNVTAMLDMAFQLLAFFVLTFRPGPFEPAVQLHLPPAQPVVHGRRSWAGRDRPDDISSRRASTRCGSICFPPAAASTA